MNGERIDNVTFDDFDEDKVEEVIFNIVQENYKILKNNKDRSQKNKKKIYWLGLVFLLGYVPIAIAVIKSLLAHGGGG